MLTLFQMGGSIIRFTCGLLSIFSSLTCEDSIYLQQLVAHLEENGTLLEDGY
jgi:hypothetical protein